MKKTLYRRPQTRMFAYGTRQPVLVGSTSSSANLGGDGEAPTDLEGD